MTTEQERLLDEFTEHLAEWEDSGKFDEIIERGKALLENGVEMSEIYDNIKSELTEWTNIVKVALEIGIPKDNIAKDYKEEIIEAIIEDLNRKDVKTAEEWGRIIVPAVLSAEELYRKLDYEDWIEDQYLYTQLSVHLGMDEDVVIDDLLGKTDGYFWGEEILEAVIRINPQKAANALKDFVEELFNCEYYVDYNDNTDLGVALDYYKILFGQGAVDELYTGFLANINEVATYGEICEWEDTVCSPQLLVYYTFKNFSSDDWLELCKSIMKNAKRNDKKACADAIARETTDQYKKSIISLTEAFLLFEIALKEKSELAYEGILAACDKETEKEGEDAEKVLDILKKVAGYMPEKASEIADKIIEADDSEETISKDDLEWYKAAYKMDNSKQEKIQSIIVKRAATEKDAEKFCKKIFGKDYQSVASPSNEKTKSSGRKSGNGTKRKKKSKGIKGIIKSLTKPLYKLFK